ncbi:M4 family metallopeptidase [Actinoplanes subtropicus]|uniref:M4 family metallopeptidase n=1 Tax=Actinoplanes subtropicus TaxID=543632 RepID=UPI0004C2C71D|nr:M4 family metallopeptidase [Actinoplanes subtropicus]
MNRTPLVLATGTVAVVTASLLSGPAFAGPAAPVARPDGVATADALVASVPAALHATSAETFERRQVIKSGGTTYVSYARSYRGLPVSGGDLVVATDAAGRTVYTSVAQDRAIGDVALVPKISADAALAVSRTRLKSVTRVEGTNLVIRAAEGAAARLAWESTLDGTDAEGPSRLTVDVDALTGRVLHTTQHVTDATGSGTGWIYGSVSLNTTKSGSNYLLQDSSHTTLKCQDAANNKTFSGSDNVWGNGTGTNKETGCVDALFVAQKQFAMLSAWLGRNGQNGNGGAWPIRVGLDDENAYYDGTQVQIGHNTAGDWISSADVVGHELGHGVDDTTPGSFSGNGTQEFVADTFGAATEWYINSPNDTPDFTVGEKVDLVGSGPIRYMYNPSLAGDDNCYSSSIPAEEVHAAAGPGNHWFYLLARGTSGGGGGQPASPTCNSSTITGLGIQKAITIMYNAMLLKTSSSSYLKYRVWTLQAAKNLYPGSCTEFNTVKAAWNAVKVPAQSGEPTC